MNLDQTKKTGEPEESFAALFAKTDMLSSTHLRPGQKVKGSVVSVSGDLVYVDLGGKSEGVIDIGEFKAEDGSVSVKEGDEVDAFFVSLQNGIRRMTTLVHGLSAASLNAVQGAFESGIPVNGEVKREVKGGFEISAGGVRCFCPMSQIDLKRGREGGLYLGRTFPFKVIEFSENGRNVVVSRRAILEEEKRANIEQLKASLSVGAEVLGTVRSLQKFGAFVEIGGIDGLIPASEITWDRSQRLSDVLAIGQNITAKVITLDWEKNRLTLSLKAMTEDPWATAAKKYTVDAKVTGTIVRLAPFGVFVNLESGIDGMVHISNLGAGRKINHPREVVETGQTVEAYVLSVDTEKRKIALSLQPKVEPKKIALPAVGTPYEGTVDKIMPFGIFLKLPDGLSGLIPNSEMGTQPGSDHKKMFPAGTVMKVVVVDVDASSGKIRLSRKAALDHEIKTEYREYLDTAEKESPGSSGFGTLGDLLKAKMEEKRLKA